MNGLVRISFSQFLKLGKSYLKILNHQLNESIIKNMTFKITDTKENFKTWLEKGYIDIELKNVLSNASILIVPFENLRENIGPVFPTGTDFLLQYFQNRLPQEISIDICISDNDYQTFEFNNHYRKIGKFVIKSVAVPIFISIISAYIYDKYIKSDESKPQIQVIDNSSNTTINHIGTLTDKQYLEPTHIDFSVTVESLDGTSKTIEYEGPATEVETVLKALKEYEE